MMMILPPPPFIRFPSLIPLLITKFHLNFPSCAPNIFVKGMKDELWGRELEREGGEDWRGCQQNSCLKERERDPSAVRPFPLFPLLSPRETTNADRWLELVKADEEAGRWSLRMNRGRSGGLEKREGVPPTNISSPFLLPSLLKYPIFHFSRLNFVHFQYNTICALFYAIIELTMHFPVLARKMKKFASQHILQLKHLLSGHSFSKFKRLYRLKGELGHGGFGIVYRGVRIDDQLPVAVKFIERRHVREWAKLNEHRVPMEIALLARCAHIPGVIALLDWFSLPEGFLIVMERPSPCMDLFDFIHHQKALDEDLARFLFRQIVGTVIELAERKVLHRDLKDENILVDLATGHIKLIDFGAATPLTRNRYHDFQGTRLYCPPEWFLHSLYLGREATVWSLGVLLYNMLNGRLPFLNEKDICTSHLLGPLPFFAALSKDARDLLAQSLHFETFSRPSLEQILAHPWLTTSSPDWVQFQLGASCIVMTEGRDVEGEGEGREESGRKRRKEEESGLASSEEDEDGGQSSSEPAYEEAKDDHSPQHLPLLTMPSIPATLSPLANRRRNAQTVFLAPQTDQSESNGTAAENCNNKQRGKSNKSLDSGNASALHSPRIALACEFTAF